MPGHSRQQHKPVFNTKLGKENLAYRLVPSKGQNNPWAVCELRFAWLSLDPSEDHGFTDLIQP